MASEWRALRTSETDQPEGPGAEAGLMRWMTWRMASTAE